MLGHLVSAWHKVCVYSFKDASHESLGFEFQTLHLVQQPPHTQIMYTKAIMSIKRDFGDILIWAAALWK